VRGTGFLVYVQEPDAEGVAAATKAVDVDGLWLRRVIVEQGPLRRLPFADNTVDLVVAIGLSPPQIARLSEKEILRALRPRGRAMIGSGTDAWKTVTKPPRPGEDGWTHWGHGPDNNPVSVDAVIKPPFRTQWLAGPYYTAMPVVTVAAGGRVFTAQGHIAHHRREEPQLLRLTARNGYNGRLLWERRLPEGTFVHRSAFIATDETFYLVEADSCLLLDPETGAEKGRVKIPGVGGDWVWMAKQGDTLYVLGGDPTVKAVTTQVRSGLDHWDWFQLSKGYYVKPRVPWGFARTVAAYDLRKKKRLWIHREPKPIDSRAIGMRDGRVFFFAPESRVGCLNAADGKPVWFNGAAEVVGAIEAPPRRRLRGLPGFRSERMLLCTPKALVFETQQRANVVAVSPADGRLLWTREKTISCPNALFVDGRIIIGLGKRGDTHLVDPVSGKTVRELAFTKKNCVRMTSSPGSLYCRGDGLGRYDLAEDKYRVDGAIRPGCNDGAIPANGLLYVGPWLCDCNLSLIGQTGLCSAGEFEIGSRGEDDRRLRIGSTVGTTTEVLKPDERDWATYRHDSRRSACTPVAVPGKAGLLWASPTLSSLLLSAPTTAGGRVFLAGQDGKVRCLDAATGNRQWTFATTGPVRVPPTLWRGGALVGSDDGHVYALDAVTGRMNWRFRAGPVDRRIMVYGFLRSNWPVATGVLVEGGVAYAAAGLIDRDGTHVYALDAESGRVKWQNDETGHLDKDLRKGVSVQGGLTIGFGQLWLAGGNQVSPASFDLATGKYVAGLPPTGPPNRDVQRGCEVGLFAGRYVVSGGRLLHTDPDNVVSSSMWTFLHVDGKGRKRFPMTFPHFRKDYRPFRSHVPPVWDDRIVVLPANRYGRLTCWARRDFEATLEETFQAMQQIEKTRPRYQQRVLMLQKPTLALNEKAKWTLPDREILSLALAANAVVVVSESHDANGNATGWRLCALDRDSGRPMWERPLPAKPVLGGLAIDREGRIIVVLTGGRVVCIGKANAATTGG